VDVTLSLHPVASNGKSDSTNNKEVMKLRVFVTPENGKREIPGPVREQASVWEDYQTREVHIKSPNQKKVTGTEKTSNRGDGSRKVKTHRNRPITWEGKQQ